MSYSLKHYDESIEQGIRRIAISQVDKAIESLDDNDMRLDARVHDVRKRCKKLRGLVRLVRPSFRHYGRENAEFRDAARGLAPARDAAVMVQTYDRIIGRYGDQLDRRELAQVWRALELNKQHIHESADLANGLAAMRNTMQFARERAAGWKLRADGFKAISGGVEKTLLRARKAMKEARKSHSDEALHEWRKRVKYHRYHANILRRIWTGPMQAHADAADELGDLLGRHHDLAVFCRRLEEDPSTWGDTADVELLCAMARSLQEEIEPKAFAIGARLFAEKPERLLERWEGWWKIWQDERATHDRALAA